MSAPDPLGGDSRGRLVIGVTDPQSLVLLTGVPRYLSDQGWDVHVVTGGSPEPLDGATRHELAMRRDIAPLHDLRAVVGWVRLLRRTAPSHVLVGTPKAGLLGIVASWAARVPRRTYHLRGLRLEGATGVTFALLWVLEWITCRLATDVLAVSPSLASTLRRHRLAPPHRVHVLGDGSSNGVDVEHYRPADPVRRTEARESLGVGTDDLCLGFVGRVTPDKGGETLIRALAEVGRLRHDLVLVVAGGVEDEGLLTRMERQLDDAGVALRVLPHQSDLRPVYAAMDLLLLPSRREGMPNVVLEAAACGVPALVSDATGARDSVRPGVTGWVFRSGDAHDMASTLTGVWDRGTLEAAGHHARAWMQVAFARSVVWPRIDAFLAEGPDVTPGGSRPSTTNPGRGAA